MHYIVYGSSSMESVLLKNVFQDFNEDTTLTVRNDKDLENALSSCRYKPFFGDSWLLNVNGDYVNEDSVKQVISMLLSDRVTLYLRIEKNRGLWSKIRRSKKIREMDNVSTVNLNYPDDSFVKDYIFESLIKFVDDKALSYLVNQFRQDLSALDKAIEDLNGCEYGEITSENVKKIVKPDRKRLLRDLVFCVMLANRGDLKKRWQDDKLFTNAGTKEKPHQIIRECGESPEYILGTLTGCLQDLRFVKFLYIRGILTRTNVFSEKANLEKKFPRLSNMVIPVIIKYLWLSEVVSRRDISYCLNEALYLRGKEGITLDDMHFLVYRLMNRREPVEAKE